MIQKRARALFAGFLAAATASTAVLTGGPASAAPAPEPGRTLGATTTVTLVTGDVVTLGGPRGVDVTAARGREHIGFRSHTDVQGDVHVIPSDALTLVSSGRLDPRLFDVSELARAGYDDANREDLPLIVDYPGATPRTAGARTVRELPSMSATSVRAEKDTTFWTSARTSAKRIWLDGPVEAELEHSVPQIGAPRAWEAGHTGEGTTVAVLDSGIDTTHPDLSDAVTGARDFTESESGTDDRFGHGTHVASIVTGAGERFTGVAPDAKLLNGKVLDDFGGGFESGIIAGMEWAAASGADVINMSLGSAFPTDGTDPMSQAVNQLTADTGALFVVSSGNSGPGDETIGSPAAADAALTVGAVDGEDQLADFSSRGPRIDDGAVKPDITAPGVGIVAAKAAQGQIGDPAGEGYVSLSGTSMAAPHVAGAAAILAGQHPEWVAGRLKSTLMSSAVPNPELSVFEQGAGRVDVAAAVDAAVSASPASLSVGTVAWPHDDDQPIAKTVTYDNSGAEPVALDLTTDLRGPDGNPAPEGMFTLSANQVTVPAGGSAEVTLTTDTSVDATDGTYSGAVVASAGDTTVRTLVSVNREVESYDVRFSFVDRDGAPTSWYGVKLEDVDDGRETVLYDESGTVGARVPKGEYFLQGHVRTPAEDGNWTRTDIVEPAFVVDGATELTFDARDGEPIGFTVDEPDAKAGRASIAYRHTTPEVGIQFVTNSIDGWYTRPSTTATDAFEFVVEAMMARPDDTGWRFHASPYLYNLRKTYEDRVPARPWSRVTNGELAKVVSEHAVATPGMIGVRNSFLSMPLPFTLTEYYTPDTKWHADFVEQTSIDDLELTNYTVAANPRTYRQGTTTGERWNVGVFGPAFPEDTQRPDPHTWRQGDELSFGVPLHTDQAPRHLGWHYEAIGTITLLRDGEELGSVLSPGYATWTLPPEEHTYTVRTNASHSGPLSTDVSSEWTFGSAHVEGDARTAVGLLALRFAPDLDDHNRAPAGRFRIPMYAQRDGGPVGRVRTPSVSVSYDDGETWRRARVSRHGPQWMVHVNHPRNAEYVSLRASITDRNGNTAKHTIIHAYALR